MAKAFKAKTAPLPMPQNLRTLLLMMGLWPLFGASVTAVWYATKTKEFDPLLEVHVLVIFISSLFLFVPLFRLRRYTKHEIGRWGRAVLILLLLPGVLAVLGAGAYLMQYILRKPPQNIQITQTSPQTARLTGLCITAEDILINITSWGEIDYKYGNHQYIDPLIPSLVFGNMYKEIHHYLNVDKLNVDELVITDQAGNSAHVKYDKGTFKLLDDTTNKDFPMVYRYTQAAYNCRQIGELLIIACPWITASLMGVAMMIMFPRSRTVAIMAALICEVIPLFLLPFRRELYYYPYGNLEIFLPLLFLLGILIASWATMTIQRIPRKVRPGFEVIPISPQQ